MSSIAARLGNHHLCPEHLGGEVLPACASTILIAGSPAARVGDCLMCRRVKDIATEFLTEKLIPWSSPIPEAPLDTIKTGELTVLLEGRAAARFGDATWHGGFLDEGCPTVIIGATIAEAKRLRLMERLRLIDAARAKAAGMPGGIEQSALLHAADRLARNNKAVEHARLSDAVYDGFSSPEGWQRVTAGDEPPFVNPKTGFHSAVYRSRIDGSYVLAFRGTEPSLSKPEDLIHGNAQNFGEPAAQYDEAFAVAQLVHGVHGDNLSYTGHSLGGGLAAVAALATGRPATTFDAAGVHPASETRYSLDLAQANGLIDAFYVKDEFLTGIQEGSWVRTLAADAPGTKHVLPAVNADGSPRPEPFWAETKALEAFERHGRVYAIYGLEAQRSADMATIQGML